MIPTFSERVKLAVDAAVSKGQTIASIAVACGISDKAVYQWLNGSSKSVKATSLVELAELSGYKARWIATGKGGKFGLNHDEKKIVQAFSLMGDEMRSDWISTAERYLSQESVKAKVA